MILRHKNRELLRYEWTAMGGVRLLSVEESARRWLPLEFGEASAPGNEQALADRLASWLNHRTAPMGNMKANPNITARELADVLGVEQRTIERRIRVLREKGIVRRVGVDKTGHWEVLLEF